MNKSKNPIKRDLGSHFSHNQSKQEEILETDFGKGGSRKKDHMNFRRKT